MMKFFASLQRWHVWKPKYRLGLMIVGLGWLSSPPIWGALKAPSQAQDLLTFSVRAVDTLLQQPLGQPVKLGLTDLKYSHWNTRRFTTLMFPTIDDVLINRGYKQKVTVKLKKKKNQLTFKEKYLLYLQATSEKRPLVYSPKSFVFQRKNWLLLFAHCLPSLQQAGYPLQWLPRNQMTLFPVELPDSFCCKLMAPRQNLLWGYFEMWNHHTPVIYQPLQTDKPQALEDVAVVQRFVMQALQQVEGYSPQINLSYESWGDQVPEEIRKSFLLVRGKWIVTWITNAIDLEKLTEDVSVYEYGTYEYYLLFSVSSLQPLRFMWRDADHALSFSWSQKKHTHLLRNPYPHRNARSEPHRFSFEAQDCGDFPLADPSQWLFFQQHYTCGRYTLYVPHRMRPPHPCGLPYLTPQDLTLLLHGYYQLAHGGFFPTDLRVVLARYLSASQEDLLVLRCSPPSP